MVHNKEFHLNVHPIQVQKIYFLPPSGEPILIHRLYYTFNSTPIGGTNKFTCLQGPSSSGANHISAYQHESDIMSIQEHSSHIPLTPTNNHTRSIIPTRFIFPISPKV